MGCLRWGLHGDEMLGEVLSHTSWWEEEFQAVVHTRSRRASLWGPNADSLTELGVHPWFWGLDSKDECAKGVGQHPANRHQEAPTQCNCDSCWIGIWSMCAGNSQDCSFEMGRNTQP